MLIHLYLVLWASAGYATKHWAVTRDDELIPMASTLATGLWGVLAFQPRVELYHDDGTTSTVAVDSLQYAPIMLAVLSFGALLLWYYGAYPPQPTDNYDNI